MRQRVQDAIASCSPTIRSILEDIREEEQQFLQAIKFKSKRGERRRRTERKISKIKRIPDVAWQIKHAEEDRYELVNQTTWFARHCPEILDKWIRRAEAAPRRWMNGDHGYLGDQEYFEEQLNQRRRRDDNAFREQLRDFEDDQNIDDPWSIYWDEIEWREACDAAERDSLRSEPKIINKLFGFPIPPIVY